MKIDSMVENSVAMVQPKAPTVSGQSDEQLKKAAKDFETMFMNLVVKEMRESVPDSDVFGDDGKARFFQGMLDEEYTKMNSDRPAPNSLANLIYKNLKMKVGDAPTVTVPHEDK